MAESRSSAVVVAAKLQPPSPRSRTVARPDLVERLASALPDRLAVVVAPTGWGKSELVAQWLVAHDGPVAYVGVDRADNDANRLWIHLLTAIGAATSVAVDDLIAQLRAPAAQLVGDVVEPLLARLAGHLLTIVIEDLHLTRSAEVDESLLALVDGRPPGLGLVMTSRSSQQRVKARRLSSTMVSSSASIAKVTGVEPGGPSSR